MAILGSTRTSLWTENLWANANHWLQAVLGHQDFSPEEARIDAPNVDPRLIPRIKIDANDIDVHLLGELSKMGLKRGKLMTAESNPELIAAFEIMSKRAGLAKPPQLILTESKTVNALTVTPEEVVVTTGLLKILDLREVTAVLGHELGHAASDHQTPRIVANVAFGSAGAMGAYMLAEKHGMHGWSKDSALMHALDEAAVLAAGATVGGAVANQLSVRPTELDADAKGARISGDPLGLASALRKLDASRGHHPVRTFFAHLMSGYPTITSRIETLEAMAKTMPEKSLPPVLSLVGQAEAPAAQGPEKTRPVYQVHAVTAGERLAEPSPDLAIS